MKSEKGTPVGTGRSGGRERVAFVGAGRLVEVGLLLLLLALSACDRVGDPTRGTISRERFIQTNVELRQINPEAPQADSLRAAVLQEQGVTDAEMRAFVQARADRPRELAEIWAEIERRLDHADAMQDTIPEERREPVPDEDELPQEEAQEEPQEIPRGRLRVSAA